MTPRLFIAHEALDQWVNEGRAEVDGESLHDRTNSRRYSLREGVRFLEEVSGAPDVNGLVGKVKDTAQIAEMKGETMADSVILGDNAYRVQQGFVGVYLTEQSIGLAPTLAAPLPPANVPPLPPAGSPHKAVVPHGNQSQTIVALQKFFLNNVK